MDDLILRYALINAVEHGGKASEKAVLGKVLGERPELRKDIPSVIAKVRETVSLVNSWSPERQREELKRFGPVEKPKESGPVLPDLRPEGPVTLRIAVAPNGPLHLGHARVAVLNHEYAKRYGGKLILRFDDTDPKNPSKIPVREAYSWIKEDLEWLGIRWDSESRASGRLERYYSVFSEVLATGGGYVCTCAREEWRKTVREERRECPCRARGPEENLELWKRVLKGEFGEGEAVGRIKTDLNHPDPAVLDWVAFRIVDEPNHPFSSERVWPTLDFASAVDDRDFGVTHVIRGKDLNISEKRQRVLYEHFGWRYPEVRLCGRFTSFNGLPLSTSRAREGIASGSFTGFDDPRLPFLRALRKRGIVPEAVRNYIIRTGLSEVDAKVDTDILYSENRKLVDPIAKRYFFVRDPVPVKLSGLHIEETEAPLYPGKEEKRKIPVSPTVFVERTDFEAMKGREIRFMHLCNAVLDRVSEVTSLEVKSIPKIHWVPEGSLETGVVMPDASVVKGLLEPSGSEIRTGEICQFERFGFVRRDGPVFFFAHR